MHTPTKVTVKHVTPDRPWHKPTVMFTVQQATTVYMNGKHVTYEKVVEIVECYVDDVVGRELIEYRLEQQYPNRVGTLDLTPAQLSLV